MNDIADFIEAHDDRLTPGGYRGSRSRPRAGLPFSEKPYRDGEDFNPYVFDGSMSIEDFELMHRMIEKERSEQMAEPILSGYLSNLGKYTEGRPAGEWVTFPTTSGKDQRHRKLPQNAQYNPPDPSQSFREKLTLKAYQ